MFDIQDLVHLEQNFFDAGYEDGFAHGRIHGLIEGRALGREKGFEIWEEIGFYEGFALVWQDAYDRTLSNDKDTTRSKQTFSLSSTSLSHIRHLLQLISQFHKVTPKSSQVSDRSSSELATSSESSDPISVPESEIDMLALLNNIRARYKALSASLGIRGRVTGSLEADVDKKVGGEIHEYGHAVQRTKQPIWKIDIDDGSGHDTSSKKSSSGSKLDQMSF